MNATIRVSSMCGFGVVWIRELLPPQKIGAVVTRERPQLQMPTSDQDKLRAIAKEKKYSPRMKLRAKICLMAAWGVSNRQIAQLLATTRTTVVRSQKRYFAGGLTALFLGAIRGPSSRQTALPLRRKIFEAIGASMKNDKRKREQGRKVGLRELGRRFGVSHMTISRLSRNSGFNPICRAIHKKEIQSHRGYLVGLSPQKILAVGIDKSASKYPEIRKKVGLVGRHELVGFRLHIAAFGSATSRIRPRCRRAQEFIFQLDQLAHPKLRLHLYCDSRLERFKDRLMQSVRIPGRLEFHFSRSGDRWSEFVQHELHNLQEKRFRLVNCFPMIKWLEIYGKMPMRHPPNYFRVDHLPYLEDCAQCENIWPGLIPARWLVRSAR